ncbi:MAG: Spy/CpxP family protein refolding chaperone [Deltaproteobacteria bacterium]|nr:Spy/CpxP family protein refolding chaperone [Deltaproteobacteria bacterium]
MRSNRMLHFTLPAALAMAVALFAWASQAPAFPRGQGHDAPSVALEKAAELGLTDEQVQQVRSLREKQLSSMAGPHDALKSRQAALRALLSADPIDRGAAEREIDALVKESSDFQRRRLQAKIDLAEILTPEQRGRLKELNRPRRGRPGHR